MCSLQQKQTKYSDEMESVRSLFQLAPSIYSSLHEIIDSSVSRTEWSTRARYSVEPLHFEILNFPRGRLLKGIPKTKCNVVASGFNQDDRLVSLKEYVEFVGQCYEEFLQYKQDRIVSYLFSYSQEKEAINVCQYILSDGNIQCFQRFAMNGHSSTVYEYSGGRVVRYHHIGQDRFGIRAEHIGMVSHFDDGAVERIVLKWITGEEETIYKSRRKRN